MAREGHGQIQLLVKVAEIGREVPADDYRNEGRNYSDLN